MEFLYSQVKLGLAWLRKGFSNEIKLVLTRSNELSTLEVDAISFNLVSSHFPWVTNKGETLP